MNGITAAGASGVDSLDPTSAPGVVYQRMLDRHELGYQRCEGCGHVVFYARVLCPTCGSDVLTWHVSGGSGTVYSVTTVAARDEANYNVSLVDLDEGFRMMTNVVDADPAVVRIGRRVHVVFRVHDDVVLPQFVLEVVA